MVEHSTEHFQEVESIQLIPQLNFTVIILITPDQVLQEGFVKNQEPGLERLQLASKVTNVTVFICKEIDCFTSFYVNTKVKQVKGYNI